MRMINKNEMASIYMRPFHGTSLRSTQRMNRSNRYTATAATH